MKISDRIKDLLAFLIILCILFIGLYFYNKAQSEIILKIKEAYVEKQKSNEKTQKKANRTISDSAKKIKDLESDIQVLRNKPAEVKIVTEWRTKWKTKIVKEIEYVTLPAVSLDNLVAEKDLCFRLVAEWKKISAGWKNKYISEHETHVKAKEYIKVLEKKKKRFSLGIGVIAGTNGYGVGLYFGYNLISF